tara:strand:+ start:100 stop:303 length:204 start_codon:yes stop_codon:yes gene_type:complete
MIGFILQAARNKKAIEAALRLVQTIQATTSDGRVTRSEQSRLLTEFWALVKEVRGVDSVGNGNKTRI